MLIPVMQKRWQFSNILLGHFVWLFLSHPGVPRNANVAPSANNSNLIVIVSSSDDELPSENDVAMPGPSNGEWKYKNERKQF